MRCVCTRVRMWVCMLRPRVCACVCERERERCARRRACGCWSLCVCDVCVMVRVCVYMRVRVCGACMRADKHGRIRACIHAYIGAYLGRSRLLLELAVAVCRPGVCMYACVCMPACGCVCVRVCACVTAVTLGLAGARDLRFTALCFFTGGSVWSFKSSP